MTLDSMTLNELANFQGVAGAFNLPTSNLISSLPGSLIGKEEGEDKISKRLQVTGKPKKEVGYLASQIYITLIIIAIIQSQFPDSQSTGLGK
jgi:hypothetical protein